MLYAIYAADNRYQGCYGMEVENVVECMNLEEAIEIAREYSYDVINSCGCIMDDIYSDAIRNLHLNEDEVFEKLEEGRADDIYGLKDIVGDLIDEDVYYEVVELDENCEATLEYLNSLSFDEVVNKFRKVDN